LGCCRRQHLDPISVGDGMKNRSLMDRVKRNPKEVALVKKEARVIQK